MAEHNSGQGATPASVAAVKVDTVAIIADLANATDGLGALKILIDAVQADLDNGTDGLGALKLLIDAVQADLDNGTDGLGALKALIDLVQVDTTAIIADLDNGTDGLGALKALIDLVQVDTTALIADHGVPTADVATNTLLRDVIGNKTDAAARTADVTSLVGLTRKALDEATEVARHFHNFERWFGPAATPSGTTHVADPIGEVGGTPAGVITSFRATAGANKTWGTAVQIWGSTDYTLMPTGKQASLDMHRFRITGAETDRKNWYLRIIEDDTSAADGVTADTYGIIPIFEENTDKSIAPVDMLMARILQTDATMMWVQVLNPDDNDADYIDMQFGVHGYPE